MKPPKMDKGRREWLAGLKVGDEVAVCGTRALDYAGRITSKVSPPIRGIVTASRNGVVTVSEFGTNFVVGGFDRGTGKARVFRKGWLEPFGNWRKGRLIETAQRFIRDPRFGGADVTDEKILAIAAVLWPEDFGDGK